MITIILLIYHISLYANDCQLINEEFIKKIAEAKINYQELQSNLEHLNKISDKVDIKESLEIMDIHLFKRYDFKFDISIQKEDFKINNLQFSLYRAIYSGYSYNSSIRNFRRFTSLNPNGNYYYLISSNCQIFEIKNLGIRNKELSDYFWSKINIIFDEATLIEFSRLILFMHGYYNKYDEIIFKNNKYYSNHLPVLKQIDENKHLIIIFTINNDNNSIVEHTIILNSNLSYDYSRIKK